MPELPDVEGFKRYYARFAAGRVVEGVAVPAPAIVRNATPPALAVALRGARLERPSRHGKWMLAPTRPSALRSGGAGARPAAPPAAGGPGLAFHFGMTGFLRVCDGAEPHHRHDRLVLRLDRGELRYRNMRMLGGVWLLRASEDLATVAGPLGPDAAAVDRDRLEEILGAGRGSVKALLMNQRRIAGIGNELSDEVLWRARLHPRREVAALTRRERARLHAALADVIAISNRHGRIPTAPEWLKSQRGARDPRCPRCRSPVRRSKVAGRTAYWCPRCQRA